MDLLREVVEQLDGFPPDEEPVPQDGNPHPIHGHVAHVNPDVTPNWIHDLAGAGGLVLGDAGSTANFFRRSGPSIHLSVEQVLQGNHDSSTSSEEVTSLLPLEDFGSNHKQFHIPEELNSFLSTSFHSAMLLRDLQGVSLKRTWDTAFASSSVQHPHGDNEEEDLTRAIVHVKLVLHAIVLRVWAHSVEQQPIYNDLSQPVLEDFLLDTTYGFSSLVQSTASLPVSPQASSLQIAFTQEETTVPPAKKNLLSAFDGVGSFTASSTSILPPRPPRPVVSLPTTVSLRDNSIPLATTTVRRSPRLNKSDGFQHAQYTPKKRRRSTKQPISSAPTISFVPVAAIPKLQGEDPGPIAVEVLQGWGIECGVPPEVITKEAILKLSSNDDN
ncbi:hypothetical protein C2845_PM13G08100 [Panicum miliaceum]|uniref:Uncharacterized protein n=1 Tax=Panicum miliaceum TaxID=4540 RepID=A0A3L6RHF4_PANMI|nr:hypothetical protein C2845_PM13G08100 [Panicum miliaceum]